MESTPKLKKVELDYSNDKETGERWVLTFIFDNGTSVRCGVKDIRQSQMFSMEEVERALAIAMESIPLPIDKDKEVTEWIPPPPLPPEVLETAKQSERSILGIGGPR